MTYPAVWSFDRVLAVLGAITGVLGLFFAWYFYRAALPSRSVEYFTIRDYQILGTKAPDSQVSLSYSGVDVDFEKIAVTRFFIWNAGNTPILPQDILEDISVGKNGRARIIDSRVYKASRSTIKSELKIDEEFTRMIVRFAILEPLEGIVLDVIYAGDAGAVLELNGSVIGAPSPVFVPHRFDSNGNIVLESVTHFSSVASAALAVIMALLVEYLSKRIKFWRKLFRTDRTSLALNLMYNAIALVIFVLLAFVLLNYYNYFWFISRVPSSLAGI